MATVALNAAKSYYEEKHDRGSFVKNIISDNIMLGDIYVRAKELRVTADVPRGVFVVRTLKKGESVPTDVIQSLFPDRQNDFVLSIGEGDVVLIRQMPEGSGIKELNKIASSIEEALRSGGSPRWWWASAPWPPTCGTWPRATRRPNQLPTTLCEMFLQEVFKKNPIDALDKETFFTIHKFFEKAYPWLNVTISAIFSTRD